MAIKYNHFMRRDISHIYPAVFAHLTILLAVLFSLPGPEDVYAYSDTKERPVFLAWPLPSYIGVARISQFPNTPWTWNYLGLNPGQQCPPAFGYITDASLWGVWKDVSLPADMDIAKADPHNFMMVNCYSTSGVAGENGHEATDIKAPPGTPAYAAADGRVAGWRSADVNTMMVLKHCLGGQWDTAGECTGGTKWYTTYMHINLINDLLKLEQDVEEGTVVGTIYNQGDNSHLHFEAGLDQRAYKNYVNPWGRDEAPWVGCMWADQSLCVQPNPGGERMLMVTEADRTFLRDDNARMAEIHGLEKKGQMQITDDRVAVRDVSGVLFAHDIPLKSSSPFASDFKMNWVNLGQDVASYQIAGERVAVLGKDGTLKIKDGDLASEWLVQMSGVLSVSISPHRTGILLKNGDLAIMEGSLNGDWIIVAKDVSRFQLIDSRIAIVDSAGNLFVQEGPLTAEWRPMAENVQSFQLTGTRVAIVDQNGDLLVNDGNLRAPWVLQASDVLRYQLADDRILILNVDGKWLIRNGDLYQTWTDLPAFLQDVVLSGPLPVQIK